MKSSLWFGKLDAGRAPWNRSFIAETTDVSRTVNGVNLYEQMDGDYTVLRRVFIRTLSESKWTKSLKICKLRIFTNTEKLKYVPYYYNKITSTKYV